jgi:glycosyltransferase involved in cell wall biosynthesis
MRGLSCARMKIAMLTETYPPEVNGVARTVHEMVEGLRRRGHSIRLARPRQNDADLAYMDGNLQEWLGRGIAIPRYPQLKMGLPAKRALIAEWMRWRPEIVHIATEGPMGWSGLAAARALGIPVATDFHTNFHTYSRHYGAGWLARPVMACLRHFHNRAGCTMVPTAELAEELAAHGFRGLRIVGRGVNPDVFTPARRSAELRAQWGADDDTPVALCVSRFAPEKNFPLVIKAFETMRRIRPDARLVLVGDGPMADELRRRGVGYVVAGRKVNGELSAHYASADIFLFASTSETFGNVVVEAMASGLAIVAYRYAAAREHLRDGETALLAPLGDDTAFIAAAERAVAAPALVRRLGRAARSAGEALTWQRIVGDFEAVLKDVAA